MPPAFPTAPESKLLSTREAISKGDWPRPLVFTNGVFDVLHVGHVHCLAQARALGASLVVALNSDASARGLGKGPDRPLNREHDRALVVAALAAVDFVTLFDEPTPCELIEQLKPDVYVKGGDYDPDTHRPPEASVAEGIGATVVYIPQVTGRSTSGILRQIRSGSA